MHAEASDDGHGPLGSLTAGAVHIVGQDEFFSLTLEEPRLFIRKGRPQGRYDVVNASVMGRDDIHIAFYQNGPPFFENRLMGHIHGKQEAPFIENRRFRGIEVFRLAVVEDSPAETDDAAAAVADGKHDPAAKSVVKVAIFSFARPSATSSLPVTPFFIKAPVSLSQLSGAKPSLKASIVSPDT